jgi:hypothetical protein
VNENLAKNSDSLVQLLAEQCTDLEKLLSLAKEETVAAKEGRFTRVWDIVSERNAIGRRLETFHQQIAELRSNLESQGENPGKFDITDRVIELANLTLIQDQETRLLLTSTRDETAADMRSLDKAQAGTNAYLRQPTRGLSYDRSF